MKTLILGGVRSGKSRHATEIASAQALEVTVIATATAQDREMAERIEAHRANRPGTWTTIEEPVHLAAALRLACAPSALVIVDCLTLWLTNLMCGNDPQALSRESSALLATLAEVPGDCVLVTNEVGFGIVPANALARAFADRAGELHQRLAALCDRVILMAAGIPLIVKSPAGAPYRARPDEAPP